MRVVLHEHIKIFKLCGESYNNSENCLQKPSPSSFGKRFASLLSGCNPENVQLSNDPRLELLRRARCLLKADPAPPCRLSTVACGTTSSPTSMVGARLHDF